MKLEIQQIARMTGGRLFPPAARGTVTGISTDSRTLRPGELFVALRGPQFDGHDYLLQAVRKGAAACLCEEVTAAFPVPVVTVDDTLTALGNLAASFRHPFSGPLIAVTGSSGKTTTKDMLAAILGQGGDGLATAGNFNNLIGLPLTLLQLAPRHRWVVLEMGMSARGEIARLAEIAAPGVGVITNIGPAHLEELQSLDGVARAKGELFAALTPGATAVINADDERVMGLPVANGVHRLLFGQAPEATVRAESIGSDGEAVHFDLLLPSGRWPVRLAVPGRHNVANALAAAAAGMAVGVTPGEIVAGLEAFRPRAGRLEVVHLPGDILLFDDSYNANPLSMKAALTALAESGGRRKIAVLGDMLELGPMATELHQEVGREVVSSADRLLVLGNFAAATAAGARDAGMDPELIRIVAGHEEAVTLLRSWLHPGDRVLVKGSRGMRMEKVSGALRAAETCRQAGNC